MKRYRVWEANRKVFLWPENWLEPELRDDQSPFFKEAMSELLQSDITDDTAATAHAQLSHQARGGRQARAVRHVPSPGRLPGNDVVHVVARTAGAHRKYYYRRLEDRHGRRGSRSSSTSRTIRCARRVERAAAAVLAPHHQAVAARPHGAATCGQREPLGAHGVDIKNVAPTVTVQAVLCWSEYYNGKWQATKTSDVKAPIVVSSSLSVSEAQGIRRYRISSSRSRATVCVSSCSRVA